MILLDGKKCADELKDDFKYIVKGFYDKYGVSLKLCVVQVGDDAASSVYVRNKEKACEYVGIEAETLKFDNSISEIELLKVINDLNNDDSVTSILVQLPLPEHICERRIMESIDQDKDADCLNPVNIGLLSCSNVASITPCTPQGVIWLLSHYGIDIEGKHCVIVGRSNIVGKPLAVMLTNKNATVTLCHSKTKNLKEICKQADILICSIGKPKFFDEEYVKDGAVVVDVGINRTDDGKLCGDVDFDAVKDKVYAITPVPGGCGPMTITGLIANVIYSPCSYKLIHAKPA